jgi:ABC-type Fe3+/spermidine/putrescine transport system ATPase subunit
VRFDGQDITTQAPERRRFALMFQDYALFPHLDVRDNVAFGRVEQGLPRRAARDEAQTLLERFGLAGHARSRVWTLSGGEQQRVALARALITQPRLLLLDEPFAALDTALRQSLREDFRARIAQAGMACLLVTHDEAEARALAARAFRLADGHLQALW